MPATLPNLFVVGAMKSGTSTLCRYLGEHPDIFVGPSKEPMHFSRISRWDERRDEYLRNFAGARGERFLVDGSTDYAKLPEFPGVCERVHRFSPDARIVYFMRDPLERIISQYKHMTRRFGERRPLVEAVLAPGSDYLPISNYALQIAPYLERFGAERVYLGTFEQLVREPLAVCQDLFGWLGVDDRFEPPSLGKTFNDSPTGRAWIDSGGPLGRLLIKLGDQPAVRACFPPALRRRVRMRVDARGVATSGPAFEQQAQQLRDQLTDQLAAQARELSTLTGLSVDHWPTVERAAHPQAAS